MREPWEAFVADGAAPGHGVEIYGRDDDLVDSVVAFVGAGIDADAPAVVVATPAHAEAILARVDGPILVADAASTLASLYADSELAPSRFHDVIGGMLDEASGLAPGAPRVFGEMVDLLCARGDVGEAMALEELWEELRTRRPFSLLCGYRLD